MLATDDRAADGHGAGNEALLGNLLVIPPPTPDQTCALGASLFGAVAAGVFPTLQDAQKVVCAVRETVYQPDPAAHATYRELYALYRTLHDAFGTASWSGTLSHVMKDLIALRQRVRRG